MALSVEVEKRLGSFSLQVQFQAETEVLALLGASGCGKSMTLKCIAGIERPERGRIVLDGRVLFDSEKRIDLPPQKRRVGYLFQQYALFPNMTAEQNIAAGAGSLEKSRRKRKVAELAAMLHLEDTLKKRPHQLSGGQQQRVALARILASEPAVILLDEPFSALDSYLKYQLELELSDLLRSFGGTALWVSHDRGEVFRNCRRVCLLEDGRSAPVREMAQLMADPGTVSAARLSGCKNFAPVLPGPESGTVEVPCWGLRLRCAAPWRQGVTAMGIRANTIRPAGEGENLVPCRVERVVEDVFTVIVLLRPEGSRPDAPLLRMELPKEQWRKQDALAVSLPPEQILLLEP